MIYIFKQIPINSRKIEANSSMFIVVVFIGITKNLATPQIFRQKKFSLPVLFIIRIPNGVLALFSVLSFITTLSFF
jgi:hypothetical protein